VFETIDLQWYSLGMTTPYDKLGKLERIDLRDVWGNESSDFTPWLAREESLSLLGDTLGLDLELQGREQVVGPFKADILCKDTSSDTYVLIENQIERTDHGHLGQLLTYAAGLKAVTIVWIAARFTDEHRAALDWLNQITDKSINFFGLEIELWKIGQSSIAPKFNIVSKPNDWSKTIAQGVVTAENSALTESKMLQLEYWTAFAEYVSKQKTVIRTSKPLPQHWMNMALGRSGTKLNAIASFKDTDSESFDSHEIRAEVILFDGNSKQFFHQLYSQKDEIEKLLGEPLRWHNPDDARMCRIILRKPTNLEERTNWSEQHRWLLQKLEALHRVFNPRIKALLASPQSGVIDESADNELAN
jgi:hypothetical protein